MSPEEKKMLERRKSNFDDFYKEMMPVLVDFIGKMGISPAHEVLKNATQFSPYLDHALQNMDVSDEQDRIWLLARLGYFIGEYFVQKYSGHWYVNEIVGSRYFGQYVVGRFVNLGNMALMVAPFQIAQAYIEESMPRQLEKLLIEVDAELIAMK